MEKLKIYCTGDLSDESSITRKLCALDEKCYETLNPEEDDFGTEDYWIQVRKSSFCFVAEVDNDPVAYVDFLVLNKNGENFFKSGKFRDGQLEGCLESGPFNESLVLYVTSIVTDTDFRGRGLIRQLFKFSREYFSNRGFKISRLYAGAWSSGGEAIIKKLGATALPDDDWGHKCFEIITPDGLIPLLK